MQRAARGLAAAVTIVCSLSCASTKGHSTGAGPSAGGADAAAATPGLDTSDVDPEQFGKLFERGVDGVMFAQPSYVGALPWPDGTTRNIVYLATEHDSVYAFDADDPAATAPLWQVSLGTSTPLPNPWFGTPPDEVGCKQGGYNLSETGITSTPAVDVVSRTLYVVAFVRDDAAMRPDQTCMDVAPTSPTFCQQYSCSAPTFHMMLHALDLTTGKDRAGSPVEIEATFAGSGADSNGGVLTFDPTLQLQRTALLLSRGTLYIAFSSYGDLGNYHGSILGYDARSLAQVATFNDTPDGTQGGIWQAGHGLVPDEDGNIYVITGNGTFSAEVGGRDFGNTLLKLDPHLNLLDWFAPKLNDVNGSNLLDAWDGDFGSAAPVLVPNTNMVIGGGKMGVFYVLDRGHLGNFDHDNDDVLQTFMATWRFDKTKCGDGIDPAQILGTPVVWNAPDGVHLFVWGLGDYLRVYRLHNGTFGAGTTPCFCGPTPTDPGDVACGLADSVGGSWASTPGGFLTLSIDPVTNHAILWATRALAEGAATGIVPGVLEAYDASDTTHLLWSSADNSSRDGLGGFAKFNAPVVANGKVYVAASPTRLVVYGLL